MESNELKFTKAIEELKYTARQRGGYVTRDEVLEALSDMALKQDQTELVFDYLKSNRIGIDAPLDSDEYLSSEDKDLYKMYEEELKSVDKISEEQKDAYIMAAMNNDFSFSEELINYYLPKVVEISKLYASQGVMTEDLIGEGNLALTQGIYMLSASENPKDAENMLTGLIMSAMEELISENYEEASKEEKIADKVNKVAQKAAELAKELGRSITVDELSENTSLSKKAIIEAVKMSGNKIEDIDFKEE